MSAPSLTVRLAQSETDVLAAQRLRYRVFVEEMGSDGPLVDHVARLERDLYDDHADQLVLIDPARKMGAHVVGVYRLMDEKAACAAGQFYSQSEYDLGPLKRTGKPLLELGRSCLDPQYRGTGAMMLLWSALAEYIEAQGIGLLFGVASFHGTDANALAEPLSLLHHRHLAPEPLRIKALGETAQRMDLIGEDTLDRRRAMLQVPALIKAYLRLGGTVGEGAFVDHEFNTTDVCLVLDTSAMNARQRRIYEANR